MGHRIQLEVFTLPWTPPWCCDTGKVQAEESSCPATLKMAAIIPQVPSLFHAWINAPESTNRWLLVCPDEFSSQMVLECFWRHGWTRMKAEHQIHHGLLSKVFYCTFSSSSFFLLLIDCMSKTVKKVREKSTLSTGWIWRLRFSCPRFSNICLSLSVVVLQWICRSAL